jgi:uncharacterized protein
LPLTPLLAFLLRPLCQQSDVRVGDLAQYGRGGRETMTESASKLHGPKAISRLSAVAVVSAAVVFASIGGLASTQANPKDPKATLEKSCPGVGTVWWNEFLTTDPERAAQFYSGVIGWTPKTVALSDHSRGPKSDEARYTLMQAFGRDAAGLMNSNDPNAIQNRSGWFIYIQVENIDATVAAARAKGGKVINGPFVVPDTGRIAVIEDPFGVAVGLITPADGAPC